MHNERMRMEVLEKKDNFAADRDSHVVPLLPPPPQHNHHHHPHLHQTHHPHHTHHSHLQHHSHHHLNNHSSHNNNNNNNNNINSNNNNNINNNHHYQQLQQQQQQQQQQHHNLHHNLINDPEDEENRRVTKNLSRLLLTKCTKMGDDTVRCIKNGNGTTTAGTVAAGGGGNGGGSSSSSNSSSNIIGLALERRLALPGADVSLAINGHSSATATAAAAAAAAAATAAAAAAAAFAAYGGRSQPDGAEQRIDVAQAELGLAASNSETGGGTVTGGRLQFYKDGKFILELARSRDGEKTGWVSVPRKTYWPPTAPSPVATVQCAATKNESSTSLSFSDDNSSIQSSPWQRDHCWKQPSPQRSISQELALFYFRPARLRLAPECQKMTKLKRRRPHDAVTCRLLFGDVDAATSATVPAETATPSIKRETEATVVVEDPLADAGSAEPPMADTKTVRLNNRKLGAIVQKLIDKIPTGLILLSKTSSSYLPTAVAAATRDFQQQQQHVSPRKRILRDMEKVSLEDTTNTMKRSRAKSATIVSAMTAAPQVTQSAPSNSHTNHRVPPTANGDALSASSTSSSLVPAPRPFSSYSITSLLGHNTSVSSSTSSSSSSSSSSVRPTTTDAGSADLTAGVTASSATTVAPSSVRSHSHQLHQHQHHSIAVAAGTASVGAADSSPLRAMLTSPNSPDTPFAGHGANTTRPASNVNAKKKASPAYSNGSGGGSSSSNSSAASASHLPPPPQQQSSQSSGSPYLRSPAASPPASSVDMHPSVKMRPHYGLLHHPGALGSPSAAAAYHPYLSASAASTSAARCSPSETDQYGVRYRSTYAANLPTAQQQQQHMFAVGSPPTPYASRYSPIATAFGHHSHSAASSATMGGVLPFVGNATANAKQSAHVTASYGGVSKTKDTLPSLSPTAMLVVDHSRHSKKRTPYGSASPSSSSPSSLSHIDNSGVHYYGKSKGDYDEASGAESPVANLKVSGHHQQQQQQQPTPPDYGPYSGAVNLDAATITDQLNCSSPSSSSSLLSPSHHPHPHAHHQHQQYLMYQSALGGAPPLMPAHSASTVGGAPSYIASASYYQLSYAAAAAAAAAAAYRNPLWMHYPALANPHSRMASLMGYPSALGGPTAAAAAAAAAATAAASAAAASSSSSSSSVAATSSSSRSSTGHSTATHGGPPLQWSSPTAGNSAGEEQSLVMIVAKDEPSSDLPLNLSKH